MMMLDDVLERAAVLEFDANWERQAATRRAFLEIMGENLAMPIEKVLWCCSPADAAAEDEAREFIRANGYTRETVRLIRSGNSVQVIKKGDSENGV